MREYSRFCSNFLDDAFGHDFGKKFTGSIPSSSWVAEIVGFHSKYKYDRIFLQGKRDYSRANSAGSRGIFAWYILESGKYYEIKQQTSWKKSCRYFAKVDDTGEIIEVKEEEVRGWLRNLSE